MTQSMSECCSQFNSFAFEFDFMQTSWHGIDGFYYFNSILPSNCWNRQLTEDTSWKRMTQNMSL
jgi:hypothetical protein